MERRNFLKAVLAAPIVGATIASKASATPTGTRISVDEKDPGYDPGWHTADVKVFLDGKERTDVLTADSKEGYVRVWNQRTRKSPRVWKDMYGKVVIKVNGRIYNG